MWRRPNRFLAANSFIAVLLSPLPASAQVIPEDIVILMDASGSLGAAGWADSQAFVTQLDDAMPGRNLSRVGIIEFATGVTTQYDLTSSQTPATVDAFVNALPYAKGSAYTKDAVQQAIDMFSAESPTKDPRLLILLTDGVPNPTSQSPNSLDSTLVADNIPWLVVGHSAGFDASAYANSTTGGQTYTYSDPIGSATATQFLSDAAQYFGLGTAVPEPSSAALVLGAVGLAVAARRRRRSSATFR